MTQEKKQLLLQDLCTRLPYGVKVTWDGKHPLTVTPHIYCAIASEDNINNLPKLLLRLMSSMTEEEKKEYHKTLFYSEAYDEANKINGKITFKTYDYLNFIHIDFRGLIHKGLAIEVTEENNPYKQ